MAEEVKNEGATVEEVPMTEEIKTTDEEIVDDLDSTLRCWLFGGTWVPTQGHQHANSGPGPHLIPRKNSRKCSNFTDNWQHMATRAGKLLE